MMTDDNLGITWSESRKNNPLPLEKMYPKYYSTNGRHKGRIKIKRSKSVIVTNTLTKRTFLVKCKMCNKLVKSCAFSNHLLFGSIECKICDWETSSCWIFKTDMSLHSETCCHSNLEWKIPDTGAFALSTVRQFKSLATYLKNTKEINVQPWLSGAEMLRNRLLLYQSTNKISNSNNDFTIENPSERLPNTCADNVVLSNKEACKDNDSIELTLKSRDGPRTHPSPSEKKIVSSVDSSERNIENNLKSGDMLHIHQSPSKKKIVSSEDSSKGQSNCVSVPAEEHYFMAEEFINNCPDCNATLDPMNMIFNVRLAHITCTCNECHLVVYFVVSTDS